MDVRGGYEVITVWFRGPGSEVGLDPVDAPGEIRPGASAVDLPWARAAAEKSTALQHPRRRKSDDAAAAGCRVNALAELPGIEVDTGATDFLGRQGCAIRSIDRKAGGGIEFIFDPDTSELLAERDFLSEPGRGPSLMGLPAGLTIRETAYLESAVVDSTDETGAETEAGGPVATTGPIHRK